MVIGLQNHPSYPSTHSCITAAFMTVLADEFPRERRRLEAMVEEAGLSRIYGGIHYRFDVTAGQKLGRRAAKLALNGRIE
jgi:membrane-associated phospholipid phosphatase